MVKHVAPWWLTWVLAGALAAIFVGERILVAIPSARAAVTVLGVLGVVAATGWRLAAFVRAEGSRRRAERLLALAYVGCLAAAAGWLTVSSELGDRLVASLASPGAVERARSGLQIGATIVLVVSLVPALAAQRAIGATRHATAAIAELQSFRVVGSMADGLLLALALAALLVGGRLAGAHDRTWDLSYFKTARPGSATVELVRGIPQPVRVLLFFPDGNEVGDQAETYFKELEAATHEVVVERYDRLVHPDVAQANQVERDGAIILIKGDHKESLQLSTNLIVARRHLRTFDVEVQAALMKLMLPARTVYMTIGHGELNDPATRGPLQTSAVRGIKALEQILAALNYHVEPLGLKQGLGRDLPEDATVVLILGPELPLLDEELAAIDRYLQRGGALLVALDPDGATSLGALERRLGVRFASAPLCDDEAHLVVAGNPSDCRLLATNQFSAHASVTSLARSDAAAIVLDGTGSLDEVEAQGARRTIVVRSLPSTFADLDRNLRFDAGTEAKRAYPLVAAIEGAQTPPGARLPMRAMVLADVDMLGDAILDQFGANAQLLHDALQWLAGEERYTGTTSSEQDIVVAHTKRDDVAWFYATILGAPALMVGIGLVLTRNRRRRRGAAA